MGQVSSLLGKAIVLQEAHIWSFVDHVCGVFFFEVQFAALLLGKNLAAL